MTLTDQWKKGKLEQGWYYIECIDLPKRWIDIDYYRNDCYEDEGFCKGFFDHNDWRGIDKVLAPVPSFEEWKAAYECQLMESELVLTLKELLKECGKILEDITEHTDYNEVGIEKLKTKIDNVLGAIR